MTETTNGAVTATALPLDLFARGKVRDTYHYGDNLLMVATDRISTFDVVMPSGIPRKGEALTALARYWFALTTHIAPNHLLPDPAYGDDLLSLLPDLPRRSLYVRRAARIDVECVARGYLSGSGWTEYKEHGTLAGEPLPAGLEESARLPRPVFTPAIKNDDGHDENISRNRLAALLGDEAAATLEKVTLALYSFAAEHALARGVIVADTKFEFGYIDGVLTLIDEMLTSDSSRLWPAASYRPGGPQTSLDKQPVRDWATTSGWNKQPPAPPLPPGVAADVTRRYLEAVERLTGVPLDAA